jgi:hypothetical protein
MVLLSGCTCCPLVYGFSFRGFRGQFNELNYDTVTPFGRTGINTSPNLPRPTPALQSNGRHLWYNSWRLETYNPFYAPPPAWYGLVSVFAFGGLLRVVVNVKVETEYTATKCRCYLTLTTVWSVTEIVYERDIEHMPEVRASGIFRFGPTHIVALASAVSPNSTPVQRWTSLCTTPIIPPPQLQQSDIGEITLFRDSLVTPGFVEAGQTLAVSATLNQYTIPAGQPAQTGCNAVNLNFSFSQLPKAMAIGQGSFDTTQFTEPNGATNLYWRRNPGGVNQDVKEVSAMFSVTSGFLSFYASINVNEILWRLYSENGIATFNLSPNQHSPVPGIHGPPDSSFQARLFDSFPGDFSYTVSVA